ARKLGIAVPFSHLIRELIGTPARSASSGRVNPRWVLRRRKRLRRISSQARTGSDISCLLGGQARGNQNRTTGASAEWNGTALRPDPTRRRCNPWLARGVALKQP